MNNIKTDFQTRQQSLLCYFGRLFMTSKAVKIILPLFISFAFIYSAPAQINQRAEVASTRAGKVDSMLVDSQADSVTKALYKYLLSQYGNRIISGQTDGYYDNIVTATGKSPMLKVYDFQHYTQGYSYKWSSSANNGQGGASFGAEPNGTTEAAIAWYNSTNKKGIVGFQWHWHSPSGGTVGTNTFYSANTTFKPSQAVNTITSQFTQIIQDIDAIAVELKKLSDAGVPVLWRPLHEASGNGANDGSGAWFWWGRNGNTVCKKLYDIVYDRMVNYHGLHNLIWVWSSPEASWYPGNTKIDILGFDSYPNAYDYTTQSQKFNQLYTVVGAAKIVTMSENGPIPDIQKCLQADVPWSYFMSWYDLVFSQNSTQHIIDVYTNPRVVTLENRDADISTLPGISTVTGIADIDESAPAVIYPNPATDKLMITDKTLAASIYKIEIINMQGDKLVEIKGYKDYISLNGIPKGSYILNLYAPGKMVRQKLIRW